MGGARESKEAKAARERERRLSEMEQETTDQQTSASLTSDFRGAFMKPNLFSILQMMKSKA
jgi:hypothetical protein